MRDDEEEAERLRRWVASLRRTSVATRQEAEQRGPEWEFYALSIASSEAQAAQADTMEKAL